MVNPNKVATVELVKALSDDLRTGANGEVYASAGAAVRAQSSKIDKTLTYENYAADAKTTGNKITNLTTETNAKINAADILTLSELTPTSNHTDKGIYFRTSDNQYVSWGVTGSNVVVYTLEANKTYVFSRENAEVTPYGFTNMLGGNNVLYNYGEFNGSLIFSATGEYQYIYIQSINADNPEATVSGKILSSKINDIYSQLGAFENKITNSIAETNTKINAADILTLSELTPTSNHTDKGIYFRTSDNQYVSWGVTGSNVVVYTLEANKTYVFSRENAEVTPYGFTNMLGGNNVLYNYGEFNGSLIFSATGEYQYIYIQSINADNPEATVSGKILSSKINDIYSQLGAFEQFTKTQTLLRYNNSVSGEAFVTFYLTLPAGKYYINIGNISSTDTDTTFSRLRIYNNGHAIRSLDFPRDSSVERYGFTLPQEATSMDFYASNNYANSVGDTFSFQNVEIHQETELSQWEHNSSVNMDNINTFGNIFRYDKYFSHIGVDKSDNIIIPCQSIADVSRAKRLGFKVMEINVRQTKDGKYVCLHGVSGNFGGQFTDINGSSVYDISVADMTLDEIKSTIRYKSKYDKYKTPPYTLQEILYECKKQNIIPLVEYHTSYTDEIEILDGIMGKNNYIVGCYSTDRDNISNAMFASWLSISDADTLVEKCQTSGGMYAAGLNVTNTAFDNFTDDDWKNLVNAVHQSGYFISFNTGYSGEVLSQKLLGLGFDYSGSGWNINEIKQGNLCNLLGDIDFSDFTTDGTSNNGVLTLRQGNMIQPITNLQKVFLGGGSLHIRFSGKILLEFGEYINTTFESDGTSEMWFSTFFEESIPTFKITANASTAIYEISYKASRM